MRFRLLAPALILLVISACATVSTSPTTPAKNAAAEQFLRDGKFAEAARAYEAEAAVLKVSQRDAALVRAAYAWEKADDKNKARALLAQSQRRKLAGDDAFMHDLLNSEFLIADRRASEAVGLLKQNRDAVPANDRARWSSARLRAFEAAGLNFDLAIEQSQRMEGLSAKERNAAGRNIERLLGSVAAPELLQRTPSMTSNDPLYPFVSREFKKRGMPLPLLNTGVAQNNQTGSSIFPPGENDGYRPPAQLAVLLPFSGNTAGAGLAVRDGLLSQYYAEKRRRPRIQFYDTAGSATGAQNAANKAIADGAQMLVGPLTREEVNAVSSISTNVPIVLLNRGQNAPAPGHLSFALSPDEEGWISADRLANRRLLNTVVFSSNDDTAQRTVLAFRDQYKIRGGQIVAELKTDGSDEAIATLISTWLASNPNIDAIYFASRANGARQVMKALAASPLGKLPKISSSFILSGANATQDVVLDGIEMPELPWLLNQHSGLANAETVSTTMPNIRGSAQRLFAFGSDAWQLSAYYERLLQDPGFSVRGATGNLRVDSQGNVQRDPTWAVFSGGKPRATAP